MTNCNRGFMVLGHQYIRAQKSCDLFSNNYVSKLLIDSLKQVDFGRLFIVN